MSLTIYEWIMRIKKTLLNLSLGLVMGTSLMANAETFDFSTKTNTNAETLVVFQSGDKASDGIKGLSQQSQAHIASALKMAEFKGENKKIVEILAPVGLDAGRVLVVGVGETDKLDAGDINELGAEIGARVSKTKQDNIQILTAGIHNQFSDSNFAAELAHGISLRAHRFDKYLKKEDKVEKHYSIKVATPKAASASYKQLQAIEAGVFMARDLTSEVPTEMNPVHFAKAAKTLKKLGVKVKVLKPKEIAKLGMGALHAVGRGSEEGSRLVIAHWQGSDDAPVALVGKGITFDSGGYNVKTHDSIVRMKSDMAGAAAVLGTVKAMAMQKAEVNVVGIMAMAANMVSETSVAPGDVVITAEGLSVEITNTDAEGRLVLADGMWYARENYQPKMMVDVATLTGSKVRAVGNDYAAIFSDQEEMVTSLTHSGEVVNEKLWRLPLAYGDMLKTPIADLRNTGTGGAGASTAAMFLKRFTGDTPWAHLDIAGNALVAKDKGVTPAGGTGHGVRLLSHWLLNQPK